MAVVKCEIDIDLDDIPEDVMVEYLQDKGYLIKQCASLDDLSKKEMLTNSLDKFTCYQLEGLIK